MLCAEILIAVFSFIALGCFGIGFVLGFAIGNANHKSK